jgi:cytochrome bd ubiquinol oxidase subunit II
MGPVWEANHVWLIFVIVILFTCFPRGFAVLNVALFVPLHLALLGIMLRGASFVFRSHQSRPEAAAHETSVWGMVFGVASLITPFLLGTSFGVVTEGGIAVEPNGAIVLKHSAMWLSPYCVANGLLALSTCAYLAAVYLTNETTGELREDFRQRAIIAGTTTAILAALVLLFAWQEANWFFWRLLSGRAAPIVALGLISFAGSAWSVFSRRYRLSRICAATEITLLILGWAVAQYPFLIYPDISLAQSAPTATLRFMVLSLPVGMALLVPSLWFLFRVFKAQPL